MSGFTRALERTGVLLDGAMGTPLLAQQDWEGVPDHACTHAPERVLALHRDFLAAGCRAITTNSFNALCHVEGARAPQLARAAAQLAREATAERADACYVLGSLGPGPADSASLGAHALEQAYAESTRALCAGGVDALLLETGAQAEVVVAAVAGAVNALAELEREVPLCVSLAVDEAGRLCDGSELPALVRRLADQPIALFGLNCGAGIGGIRLALEELRAATTLPLGIWANAGMPREQAGCMSWPLEPMDFARELAAFGADARVRLLGGCCGSTPEHLATLARELAHAGRLDGAAGASGPAPTPMTRVLEPEYMDTAEEADGYDTMDHGGPNRAFVQRLLELGADGRVLDLGTGPGVIPLLVCAERPAAQLVALDAARHMLRHARRHRAASPLGPRVELCCGDAKRLPFADDSFDVVYSNSILHHIPEPIPFLAEAWRVLRPGGALLIRDLLRPRTPTRALELMAEHAAGANDFQQELFRASLCAAFTPDELRTLARKAGLMGAELVVDSDRHLSLQRAMGG